MSTINQLGFFEVLSFVNFQVSNTGVVTASRGLIGGWRINSMSFESVLTDGGAALQPVFSLIASQANEGPRMLLRHQTGENPVDINIGKWNKPYVQTKTNPYVKVAA